jgi:hypothetical protein
VQPARASRFLPALGLVAATAIAASAPAFAALKPPAKLRVERAHPHGLELRWRDRSAGELRYEVRIEPRSGDRPTRHELPPNREGFRSRRLRPGERYEHAVRACRGSRCSAWETVRQATLLGPFGDPYPSLGSCQVFPDPPPGTSPSSPSLADQSAWNQDISQAPIHPDSEEIIAHINRNGTEFHPDFGSNPNYGIPYVVVPGAQPNVPVGIGPNGYPDESDFGPSPIPPHAPIEGGSDDHVLVVDRDACDLFELFVARYRGGVRNRWQADGTAFFDLDRAGPLRNGGEYITSADAAGLPIFAGLVRYDEVAAGRIDHALRITFEETRRAFIHPATHYASDECHPFAPPMGLRLRLRAGYPTAGLGPQASVIVEALKRYGAFVADNGGNWYVTGATDSRWRDVDLNLLKEISGSDFEVVRSAATPVEDC